jgi:hypothetical protein
MQTRGIYEAAAGRIENHSFDWSLSFRFHSGS